MYSRAVPTYPPFFLLILKILGILLDFSRFKMNIIVRYRYFVHLLKIKNYQYKTLYVIGFKILILQ
ncbi:hypothetical protein FWK35_00011475, partial [Aphis craccivora]